MKNALKTAVLRVPGLGAVRRGFKTWRRLGANQRLATRRLEIGPGDHRIPGFETLNIVDGPEVDYVCDAAEPLRFVDGTFDLIYCSHILEHIPWYKTEKVLRDWTRVLKPGGTLEVWVPDGLKICQAFVDAEARGENYIDEDGWYYLNPSRDPCVWASGRIFTYGDGTGKTCHPNWHRAIFSPRYLGDLLRRAGLHSVREMNRSEVRGYDHAWINLGMCGTK